MSETNEYWHGYYDAMVEFHKTELSVNSFAVDSLDKLSVLRVAETHLERSKLFCHIDGLDTVYEEYWRSIQLANRRAKFWGYWGRLWNALCNRTIVFFEFEPRWLWMHRVAREFAEQFRQARLVVDMNIIVRENNERKQLLFKALTWREIPQRKANLSRAKKPRAIP